MEQLTERELETLRLVVSGKRNREIACQLSISEKTVENHLRLIFAKLGVRSRNEATALVLTKYREYYPPASTYNLLAR